MVLEAIYVLIGKTILISQGLVANENILDYQMTSRRLTGLFILQIK